MTKLPPQPPSIAVIHNIKICGKVLFVWMQKDSLKFRVAFWLVTASVGERSEDSINQMPENLQFDKIKPETNPSGPICFELHVGHSGDVINNTIYFSLAVPFATCIMSWKWMLSAFPIVKARRDKKTSSVRLHDMAFSSCFQFLFDQYWIKCLNIIFFHVTKVRQLCGKDGLSHRRRIRRAIASDPELSHSATT